MTDQQIEQISNINYWTNEGIRTVSFRDVYETRAGNSDADLSKRTDISFRYSSADSPIMLAESELIVAPQLTAGGANQFNTNSQGAAAAYLALGVYSLFSRVQLLINGIIIDDVDENQAHIQNLRLLVERDYLESVGTGRYLDGWVDSVNEKVNGQISTDKYGFFAPSSNAADTQKPVFRPKLREFFPTLRTKLAALPFRGFTNIEVRAWLHNTNNSIYSSAYNTVSFKELNIIWRVPETQLSMRGEQALDKFYLSTKEMVLPYKHSQYFASTGYGVNAKRVDWKINTLTYKVTHLFLMAQYTSKTNADMLTYKYLYDNIKMDNIKIKLNSQEYPYGGLRRVNLGGVENDVTELYEQYLKVTPHKSPALSINDWRSNKYNFVVFNLDWDLDEIFKMNTSVDLSVSFDCVADEAFQVMAVVVSDRTSVFNFEKGRITKLI